MNRKIMRELVAGLVILAFFGTWLLMEWYGREPDSLILTGAIIIAIGAAYYLWDEAMDSSVEAVQDLQGGDDDDDE